MQTTNENNQMMGTWETMAKELFPEPHAESMTKQVIKMEPSVLLNDMAKLEQQEMTRVMRFTNTSIIPSDGEVEKYLTTLVWLRVLQVNHDAKIKPYAFAQKELNVPARIYQIILSLGECTDRDFGIRFVPAMDIDAALLMTPTELRDMSDRLSIISNEGYITVETGLPTTTQGELGFMACLLVNDEKVYSYRKDHPVYGFIAAFFRTELLSKAFDIDYRVYYGSIEDYRAMLSRIYRR